MDKNADKTELVHYRIDIDNDKNVSDLTTN